MPLKTQQLQGMQDRVGQVGAEPVLLRHQSRHHPILPLPMLVVLVAIRLPPSAIDMHLTLL
jgi:hypothetical protein